MSAIQVSKNKLKSFFYVHNFVKIYQLTCKNFINKESTHDTSIVVITSSSNIYTVTVRFIEKYMLTLFRVLSIFDCPME
jgi:hypothetical protein